MKPLLIALAALLSTEARAEDTVLVEIYAPVVAVEVRDGATFVQLGRGERDGIGVSVGHLFHNDQVHGSGLVDVGMAQIEEVGPDSAWARVAVDPRVAPADLTDRVTVQLQARVPERLLSQRTFHLARRGVVLTPHESQEPLFTYREFLDHPEADVDRRFYDAVRPMLAALEDQAASLAIGEGAARWRFDADDVGEAMVESDDEDFRDFLLFVETYGASYWGAPWSFAEIYATWILNGAPISDVEVEHRGLHMPARDWQAWLRANQGDLKKLQLTPQLYGDFVRAANGGRPDEAARIAAILGDLCATTKEPRSCTTAHRLRGDAEIEKKQVEAAKKAYAQAIASAAGLPYEESLARRRLADRLGFEQDWAGAEAEYGRAAALARSIQPATIESRYQLYLSENSRGWVLTRLERWDDALAAYLAAAEARNGPDPASMQEAAATYRAIGSSFTSLGRYADALQAYQAALSLSERLGWPEEIALSLRGLGDAHWHRGEWKEALGFYERARDAHLARGDRAQAATAMLGVARLRWALGDREGAVAAYDQALAVRSELGDVAGQAEALTGLADLWTAAGDYGKAGDVIARKAALVDQDPDPAARAAVRQQLGDLRYWQRRWDDSLAAYGEARALAREARSKQLEADALLGMYSALLEASRLAEAEPIGEALLAVRRELGDRAGESDALLWLAMGANGRGDEERADALAAASLAIARAMPSPAHERRVLDFVGRAEGDRGHLKASAEAHRQALALADQLGDPAAQADAHLGLAWVAMAEGRLDDAVLHQETAIGLAEKSGQGRILAAARNSQAWALYRRGRFEESQRVSKEVLAGVDPEQDWWNALVAYNTIAAVDVARGDYDAAIAGFERVRQLAEARRDPSSEAVALGNIGHTWSTQQDHAAAIRHYEAAIAKVRDRTPAASLTYMRSLSEVLARVGEHDRAEALARDALALATSLDLGVEIAAAHGSLGAVLSARGDYEAADRELRDALARAEALGLRFTELGVRRELGIVGWRAGRHEDARRWLSSAAEEARMLRSPTMAWEPLLYLGRARRDSGDLEGAVFAMQEAVAALDTGRASISDAEARDRFLENNREVYEELVALLQRMGREADAFEVLGELKALELRQIAGGSAARTDEERALVGEGEALQSRQRELERLLRDELAKPARDQRQELIAGWQHDLDELQLALQAHARRLEREHPDLADRLQVAPAGFYRIREELLPNEAFVEPVVLPDRVGIFLVRGGDAPLVYRETLIAEEDVEKLVRDMRDALSRPAVAWEATRGVRAIAAAGSGGGDPMGPARALYDLLVAPIREDLDGIDTLVVSPSGKLRYVPFAALHGEGRYLIEDYEIALLTQTGAIGGRSALPRGAEVLAVANPDGSLPGATSEVDALSETWKRRRVRRYDGADATERSLREGVGDARILHFATHGVLLPDDPEGSYLLLAGEGDEGRLTFAEITLLPLDDIDLAVLSACDTAVGEGSEGTEIAGLAYQFEVRGADTVVASLWAVNDASTSALMQELYGNLADRGTRRAQALREAQLELLSDPDWRHPYYWAPFVVIGSWR